MITEQTRQEAIKSLRASIKRFEYRLKARYTPIEYNNTFHPCESQLKEYSEEYKADILEIRERINDKEKALKELEKMK